MSPRRRFSVARQERVRYRARYLCEYCHASEAWQYVRFTIDHVIPVDKGGSNDIDNLALACFHCNRRKTNRQHGIDPATGNEAPFFNPRQQTWNEHFVWSSDGGHILGLTPIGCATIELLAMNRERLVRIRIADVIVGRHPPSGDAILDD